MLPDWSRGQFCMNDRGGEIRFTRYKSSRLYMVEKNNLGYSLFIFSAI